MSPLPGELLASAAAAGAFPGGQACVSTATGPVLTLEAGRCSPGGLEIGRDTLFDVASLTKVIATTTATWILLSRGELQLDEPVSRFFPTLRGPTIRHLLAHTSGLPAWRPHFLEVMSDPDSGRLYTDRLEPGEAAELYQKARRSVVAAAASTPLEAQPGRRCLYSDLGFILLGEIVSMAGGQSLDSFFEEEIAGPLGLTSTAYRPLPPAPPERPIAPTGLTRPREPAPGQESWFVGVPHHPEDTPGQVDDDNGWAMGGVAGHTGLFSTAEDVARWGAALLREDAGTGKLGDPEILRSLLAPDAHEEGPARALGFDLPTGPLSSAGTLLGRSGPKGARGHLGFTGCSVWIDFDRGLCVALLTNRVYPTRHNDSGIRSFRPMFHDSVIRWWDDRFPADPQPRS